MTTADVISEVAVHAEIESLGDREVMVRDADAIRVADLAVTFGAVAVDIRPAALFGHSVVTVWME